MAAERATCDTNVLFYSLDPADATKQKQADALLERMVTRNSVLILQCLGELTNAFAKKRSITTEDARRFVRRAPDAFPVVAADISDLHEAIAAQEQHGLQFWDAMLWATAQRAGCSILFSEDFQDGRRLGSVTFRNPFRLTSHEIRLLLP